MQSIIIVLLVVSLLSFSLQLSLFSYKKAQWLWLVAVGIGIYWMYPQAIQQSYSKFQQYINNSSLMGNFSTIAVFESIMGIVMSIYMIRFIFEKHTRYKSLHYVNYLPGIISFPAIFYLESYAFLHIRSLSFQTLAIVLTVAIPALLVGIRYLLVVLIPEIDLRFELKFFVHFLQLILAIVLSVLLTKSAVNTYFIENMGWQLALKKKIYGNNY